MIPPVRQSRSRVGRNRRGGGIVAGLRRRRTRACGGIPGQDSRFARAEVWRRFRGIITFGGIPSRDSRFARRKARVRFPVIVALCGIPSYDSRLARAGAWGQFRGIVLHSVGSRVRTRNSRGPKPGAGLAGSFLSSDARSHPAGARCASRGLSPSCGAPRGSTSGGPPIPSL